MDEKTSSIMDLKSRRRSRWAGRFLAGLGVALVLAGTPRAGAQPQVLDPNLGVRTVVDGLTTPVNMAFLGPNDFLVLEKNTGKVKRVRIVGGVPEVTTVLDLVVNFASERGLLSIALHPKFPRDPGIYLYWTCAAPVPVGDPFFPVVERCPDEPALDDPASPHDSGATLGAPLLGNRIDRFAWDGTSLKWDFNLVTYREFQNDGAPVPPGQGDAAQNAAGNHNGGVIRFGPDKKLYAFFGDRGRRGWMQNLPFGPTPPTPDDQFGGPEPDDAHVSGVMMRLNDDGSAPHDNPFYKYGASLIKQGHQQAGTNIQRVFSYGHRNGFGHDFDPKTGALWIEENADDAFSEINRVLPGMNGGWVQLMGPVARFDEFRFIETTMFGSNLQQLRWPPSNLALSGAEALSRLFLLPGADYQDPEFSWKFEVSPAGFTFLTSRALGREYENDLFMGEGRTFLEGGYLFHFDLTHNRKHIAVTDPRLFDRVADNLTKFDGTESESLLFGRNFGIGTDIRTGPNGSLYVVSLSNGAIYEIFRAIPEPRHDDDDDDDDHGSGRGHDGRDDD